MPTIHDILPEIEKKFLDELNRFLKADDGRMHEWEMVVTLPCANSFLHYMNGVNLALKGDNYIAATASLRGMIEILGAVVYDGTAKLPEAGYKRLHKSGRMPKWDALESKWIDLGARESVKYAQKVVDERLKLLDIYDDCCDLLHFSTKHLSYLTGLQPNINEQKRTASFRFGHSDNISPQAQKEIINICVELATGFGRCLRLGTEEKNRRKEKRSKA